MNLQHYGSQYSNLICEKISKETVKCNGSLYKVPEEKLNYHDNLFWIYLGIYLGLVLFAGRSFFVSLA